MVTNFSQGRGLGATLSDLRRADRYGLGAHSTATAGLQGLAMELRDVQTMLIVPLISVLFVWWSKLIGVA